MEPVEAPDVVEEPFSPVDFTLAQRRQAKGNAVLGLDDDPEKAARALQLSKATGVHPSLVFGDLDNFDKQHKAALTDAIVSDNPYLQEYLSQWPLAPKVSNDDYGNLDALTEALNKFSTQSHLSAAIDGYHANVASDRPKREGGLMQTVPQFAAMMATPEGRNQLWEGLKKYPAEFVKGMVEATKLPAEIMPGGAADIATEEGMGQAINLAMLLALGRATRLSKTGVTSGGGMGWQSGLDTHVAAGREPPVGLSPVVDEIKGRQADLDAERFGEAFKAANATTTRERSPEMLAEYARIHGDEKIGIPADVIRELYGDKQPESGDGVLGWGVKPEQLELAEAAGADVEVPVAHALAFMEPEVYQQIKDHIRFRDGGVSKEEAKGLKELEEAESGKRPEDFAAIGDLQRGAPESAMLGVQKAMGGGVLSVVVEHAGDLVHRMSHRATYGNAGFEYVKEKVDRVLKYLEHPYGFEKEFAENIASNASHFGKTVEQLTQSIDVALAKFGVEHTKLPALNEAHRITQEINVSIGAKNFQSAIDGLKKLREHLGSDEEWTKYAFEGMKGQAEAKPSTPVDTVRKAAGLGKQLELDVTRMEDRPPFDKGPGMPKTTYERYQRLIEKQQEEDAAYALKREQEAARKRQGEEWRKNAASVRAEVVRDVQSLPVHQVDEVLRTENVRIDPASLPEGVSVPKRYLRQGGYALDDLATHYGFDTGREMAMQLSALDSARGKMQPMEFTRRLISEETARRMEANYGDRAANALEEAKEHVLSPTQIDILAEEVIQLAEQAKQQLPIKTDALLSQVREKFAQMPIGEVSSKKLLAAAGKAGRATELALLNAEPTEAFIQKQRQWLATMMAKEAVAYEKARDQFDRNAKRFQKRPTKDSAVAPEYVNFIQDLLMRVGKKVDRTPEDLAAEIKKDGYESFASFVRAKESAPGDADIVGRDLHVPEWLQDSAFKTPLDELTVEQFKQLNDTIKAMAFNGRDELKIERAGAKADLRETIDEMIAKMETLGDKDYPVDRHPNRFTKWAKNFYWSLVNVESMLNRLDRDDPYGVFYQTLTREFADASNGEAKLIKDYQAKVSKIGKIERMDELVPNDLFIDPLSGEPLVLRRRNLLGILQNAGNESNLKKLAEGYGIEPQQVLDWLFQHTTKEDWERAQKIGDLFNEIFEQADAMSHRVSGVGIERIPIEGFENPHGTFKGWYNPIKHDSVRPGESKKLLGPSPEDEGYYRATTPQAYTKGRTGYIAPVELNLDIVPRRMQQMLHDIAMRPTIIQLSKVFYDPAFKRAMIKHYGQHQAEAMIPFLRDIAGAANFKSMTDSLGNQAGEFLRQNTIGTLIGLNMGTVGKHGSTALVNSITEVGGIRFAKELGNIISEVGGEHSSWRLAMDTSEELQRRMRNFQEIVQGHGSEINIRGAQNKFDSYREFMLSVGATPVSISDLLSAVPTWLAEYRKQKAEGTSEGMSVSLADRAVRRAHGSSVLSNKPEAMRTNSLGAMFSSLYGFFSHMFQKQYELSWKAKDLFKDTAGSGSGDLESATRHVPDLMRGVFSYVIVPAAIEEFFTPYLNAEKDSWGTKAAKALGIGVSSSVLYVRDLARSLFNLTDPQVGLIGTSMKALTDLNRDLQKRHLNKESAGKIMRDTFMLVGVLSGLTNASEGKMAEYMYRYYQGLERPKGVPDWLHGLRHGTGKQGKHR